MGLEIEPVDSAFDVIWLFTTVVVFVASYRRGRCLSGHPRWKSAVIAFVAASFLVVWLIVWWVNRERVRDDWERWRQDRAMAADVVSTGSTTVNGP